MRNYVSVNVNWNVTNSNMTPQALSMSYIQFPKSFENGSYTYELCKVETRKINTTSIFTMSRRRQYMIQLIISFKHPTGSSYKRAQVKPQIPMTLTTRGGLTDQNIISRSNTKRSWKIEKRPLRAGIIVVSVQFSVFITNVQLERFSAMFVFINYRQEAVGIHSCICQQLYP